MTIEQEQLINDAWDYCDENDKSTEFMLQYMSDVSGLSYNEVVDYVYDSSINGSRSYRGIQE